MLEGDEFEADSTISTNHHQNRPRKKVRHNPSGTLYDHDLEDDFGTDQWENFFFSKF